MEVEETREKFAKNGIIIKRSVDYGQEEPNTTLTEDGFQAVQHINIRGRRSTCEKVAAKVIADYAKRGLVPVIHIFESDETGWRRRTALVQIAVSILTVPVVVKRDWMPGNGKGLQKTRKRRM